MKRYSVLLLIACATAHLFAARATAQTPVADYDRRAAATIFDSISGVDQPWAATDDASVRKLNRFEKSPDGKRFTYAANFGDAPAAGAVDNRGTYRITRGEALADATKGGWTVHKVDPVTGLESFFRKVDTDAGKFMTVGVRKQVGPVVMLIIQKRDINESIDAAVADVTTRFTKFMAVAQKNGVFFGEIRMTLGSADSGPVISGGGVPLVFQLLDGAPKELRIDMQVIDPDGNPIEPKKYTLEFTGSFAKHARLKYDGKVLTPNSAGKYVIDDPGTYTTVYVIVPQGDQAGIQQTLYSDLDPRQPPSAVPPGLGLKAGAKL